MRTGRKIQVLSIFLLGGMYVFYYILSSIKLMMDSVCIFGVIRCVALSTMKSTDLSCTRPFFLAHSYTNYIQTTQSTPESGRTPKYPSGSSPRACRRCARCSRAGTESRNMPATVHTARTRILHAGSPAWVGLRRRKGRMRVIFLLLERDGHSTRSSHANCAILEVLVTDSCQFISQR